jgi:hypothetical protein
MQRVSTKRETSPQRGEKFHQASPPARPLLGLAAVPCPPRHLELEPGLPGLDGFGAVLDARTALFGSPAHASGSQLRLNAKSRAARARDFRYSKIPSATAAIGSAAIKVTCSHGLIVCTRSQSASDLGYASNGLAAIANSTVPAAWIAKKRYGCCSAYISNLSAWIRNRADSFDAVLSRPSSFSVGSAQSGVHDDVAYEPDAQERAE